MEPEDWKQVEEMFHRAVEMPAEERSVYLTHACSGDATLRAEVESLLSALDNRPDLMQEPAFSLGMKVLATHPGESLEGKLIGQYRVLTPIGEGGMGEVYLARDTRLDRDVALKFLSRRLVDDAWAKRQLMREAQAVAKLDHTNICPVYGFEENSGYSFIVMQHVEGQTLSSLINSSSLEHAQVPELAVQIASALSEAHSHGIIHRDIKPQNIIVTSSGQAKVLDFGLAKLIQQKQKILTAGGNESQSSQLGLVIGTVSYMSPEQLCGERLDFRTDIFSFGVVLYEMMTGKHPFARGSNAETISAILTAEAPPLPKLPPGVPAVIGRISQRCLKRDRQHRYTSASELLFDLSNINKVGSGRSAWFTHSAARWAVTVLLFLLLAIAAVSIYHGHSRPTNIGTLAVLPIANDAGADQAEYLSAGLTEALTRRFSLLNGLHVKPPTAVAAYRGSLIDLKIAGQDLGADVLVSGKISYRGNTLILQAGLFKMPDGKQIWGGQYYLTPGDVATLTEDLSDRVAFELGHAFSAVEKERWAASETRDPEARLLFYKGRYFLNNPEKAGNLDRALEAFKAASDKDRRYARAFASLADCYVLKSTVGYGAKDRDAMSKAKDLALTALNLDPRLSEARTALGTVQLRDVWHWEGAESEYQHAIDLDPGYATAHLWYSRLLALRGRPEDSIKEATLASELDPTSREAVLNCGLQLYYARQYGLAEAYPNRLLTRDANSKRALYLLGLIRLQQGRLSEAIELSRRVYEQQPSYGAALLGFALARDGRKSQARKTLRRLDELARTEDIPAQERAVIYIGLGEYDQAFSWLNKACEHRFAVLPFIKIEPLFDPIRSDPRFTRLLHCVNDP